MKIIEKIKNFFSTPLRRVGGSIGLISLVGSLITIYAFFKDYIIAFFSYIPTFIKNNTDSILTVCNILLLIYVLYRSRTFNKITEDNKKTKDQISSISLQAIESIKMIRDNSVEINKDTIRSYNDVLNSLISNLTSCENTNSGIKAFFQESFTYGINSIKDRSFYSNEYYKNMYQRTRYSLTVSGHSLNQLIDINKHKDLRAEFRKAIIRVLNNGKIVRILVQECNDSESSKIKRSNLCTFLNEIVTYSVAIKNEEGKDLSPNQIKEERLLLKEVKYLPYFVVQNEDISLIAQYKINKTEKEANKNIYVFDVNKDVCYGHCYFADLNYVFEHEASFVQY